jgi:hypothetical protein
MNNRARARARARALDRDRDLLALTLTRALRRALALERALAQGHRGPERVVPSADRLLAAAARLLPAADRDRYAQEYRSELWEIAHAGRPRRSQLLYASRQLASSVRLHAELRAPRRRKASP